MNKEKESELVIHKVRNLPDQPGVYRFLNVEKVIIYIGKAKSLKKRVSSYFSSGRLQSYRIRHMVDHITDVAYTVTNSEVEALLLENNLIKNHQPRYNILLKDGKTYPYICVKNERFPRVFSTRQKWDDGSKYYGPYPSVTTLKSILTLIRSFVPIRTCNYHLSESNIKAGKFKRCLEYQIGNCAAPCEGLQSEEDYNEGIAQVKNVLKGNLSPVISSLEEKMSQASEIFQFEKAEYFRKKIERVRAYKRKNTVVSSKIGDLEVLTVAAEKHIAIINHFKVHDGSIIQSHAWEMKRLNQEEEPEILSAALARLVADGEDLFSLIISHTYPEDKEDWESFEFQIPKIGDKKHLVELSLKNCNTLLTEKLYNQNFKKRKSVHELMMEELQKELQLDSLPDHIECFDNSNFQGSFPVASMVVFKNGKAAKKDYRKFNIKTVEGPNDFASMTEIVGRRYSRLVEEGKDLPKLIVIDGGKGQLNSASEALKEVGLLGKIPIIGIAKRLEEIYKLGDPIPLHIDKRSPALHLIQQLRNEAHRFAISFHRDQRSKGQKSKLSTIKGIGPQTEQKILQQFRSIKKLKKASEAEIEAKLGKQKAKIILKAIQAGEI